MVGNHFIEDCVARIAWFVGRKSKRHTCPLRTGSRLGDERQCQWLYCALYSIKTILWRGKKAGRVVRTVSTMTMEARQSECAYLQATKIRCCVRAIGAPGVRS